MSVIIQYKNVDIARKELVVLKHVDFKIEPGEFVYLIGRVGSGKSSLLKTMYAEVPVAAGDARVLDFDLSSIRRKDIPMLRRRIGIVFQDFQLLTDRNVFANLEFVLDATGWPNKSYKMPHELSGGEQQRIVIARALLNKPELILADEPTGNLDPETGRQIINSLYDIAASGTAVVVATHNLSMLDRFPGRVLRCADKQLIDEGTPTIETLSEEFVIDE